MADLPTPLPAPSTRLLLLLDDEGRVARWNGSAQRITGHAASVLAGLPVTGLFLTSDAEVDTLAVLLARSRAEAGVEIDGFCRLSDGRRVPACLSLDAMQPDGAPGFVATLTLREPIAPLRDTGSELKAPDAHAAIARLAAGMAHRFNNVLAAILGSLEVLCHRLPAPQGVMSLVDTALRAAARGSLLTHHLLAYAQKQTLEPRSLEVRDLIDQAAERIRATCPPTISVSPLVEEPMPLLVTDREEAIAALVHLGENARDAMPGGGVIRLEARTVRGAHDENDDFVCFIVADHGHGIDPRTREHMLEPFFTTHDAAERQGLGLSAVFGFAAQSGGRLTIESALGRGTTATLWLPTGKHAQVPPPREPELETTPKPAATVLLVDDDELVLLSTSGLLEELGWNVLSAGDGQEALQVIAEHPEIDVVLTDCVMPGMTGLELAHAVRYARPELPVVLTSGGEINATDAHDSVPRLIKPYGAQQLAAALRRAAH